MTEVSAMPTTGPTDSRSNGPLQYKEKSSTGGSIEANGTYMGVRLPPPRSVEITGNVPPMDTTINNPPRLQAPYQSNNNTLHESQMRPERIDQVPNMVRNVPMNQQMFQQQQEQQHRNIPPNYQQQNARFPSNANQIRFSNSPDLLTQNVTQRPNDTNHQIHLEQRPRFPNSVPVMQPLIAERQNLSHQPSIQNLSRQPSNQSLYDSRLQNPQQQGSIQNRNNGNYQRPPETSLGRNDVLSKGNHSAHFSNIDSKLEIKEKEDLKKQNVEEDELEEEPEDSLESEPPVKTIETKSGNSKQESFFESKASKLSSKLMENEILSSGIVLKNIKFFEEHDTAKTPLIPRQVSAEKRELKAEKTLKEPKRDGDGGVDETPMFHPNLRSILDTPIKMAKIPLYKFKKGKTKNLRFKRSETEKPVTNKQKPHWWWENITRKKKVKWSSDFFEPSKYFKPKSSSNSDKIPNFKPDEELLAFFHTSKTMKFKLKSGETKANGDIRTPQKSRSKLPGPGTRAPLSLPTDSPLKSPGTPKAKSLPKTPENPTPPTPTNKKLPMNKIQVGSAPSPNLRAAQSKVGSLVNTTHKPGGGNVRIESHKIDFSKTQSRIEAKNDQYVRSGGDKKIPQVKLQWEAKSKVGSLENTTYKPGGGDKKIESIKLDFKEKAKSKVGSKDNVKHVPGGGTIKIQSQKLEFKAQSKVGSLDNVKHKPGGGDVKIFDDKTYLRQISASNSEGGVSGTQSYGDFGVFREGIGRSVPGTPGRKTRIKIKKTTIVSSECSTPTTEHNREIFMAPKTPVREKKPVNATLKQEIKVTYLKTEPDENGLHDYNAPILKGALSKSEMNECIGKSRFDEEKSINFDDLDANKELKDFSYRKPLSHESEQPRFVKNGIETKNALGGLRTGNNDFSNVSSTDFEQIKSQKSVPLSNSLQVQFSTHNPSQSDNLVGRQSNSSLERPLQTQTFYQFNQYSMSGQRNPPINSNLVSQQPQQQISGLNFQRMPNVMNFPRPPAQE